MKFENYIKLLNKYAGFYAKKYNLDFDDTLSVCYEIYCESVETYDLSKSKFSTYLVNQLKAVPIKMYKEIKSKIRNENQESFDLFSSLDKISFSFEETTEGLSEPAYKLLKWIVSREWETFDLHNRIPNINSASKKFGVTRIKMKETFDEVSNWWNNIGYSYF